MRYLIWIVCILPIAKTQAQHTLSNQLDDYAQSIPSFYYGFTKVIMENIGDPIVLGTQMQHWNTSWRLKYGLSIATQAFGNQSFDINEIDRTELHRSESVQYLGGLNSAYGGQDVTIIRQYLLAENGDRIVNPKTGEYVSFETSMPGGLGGILAVVPNVMPLLEIRPWKGLVLAGGYIPYGYFLRDMETGSFETKVHSLTLGASLDMRQFMKIPVLSWLRFDASYSQTNIGLSNFQDAIDLGENSLINIDIQNMTLQNDLSTLQYRGTLAIPATKKVVLLLQSGFYSHGYQFNFDYDVDANVNVEELKSEYNLDFEDTDLNASGSFSREQDLGSNFYYSGGILFEGSIAGVYVGYANINYPTFAIKTTLRLL